MASFFPPSGSGDPVILDCNASNPSSRLVYCNRLVTPVNIHHDSNVIDHINLGLVSGVIIDNACILPNGQRRDYFRSHNLRNVMAKCAEERSRRPGFFVGFHDMWGQQPSAAVICRAIKVASHFEAVLEYGPQETEETGLGQSPTSLSGIEYLRRPDVSQMQKDWVQHKHRVVFHEGGQEQDHLSSACILDELETILPEARRLLMPSVHVEPRLERTKTIPPPECEWRSGNSSFWETYDGNPICTTGCVPLTACPTQEQYNAVLATQDHLRELNMLQVFTAEEIHKAVRQLQQLRPTTKHQSLLLALTQGLIEGNVVVYKGLGTGFTTPDNGIEFWGVSNYRVMQGVVDIFISRNCPSDTSTILHTWLAHHNVPRQERYEEEMLLEDMEVGQNLLLWSIRSAIKACTPSEVLSLLRRLQNTATKHTFISSMQEFCRMVLLDETDVEAMNNGTSSGFLSGSVSMNDLLTRRLSRYASHGAKSLPSVECLVQLYDKVEGVVNTALFQGDRETLARLTAVVGHGYQAETSGKRYINMNTDLLMLMYFCALRKAGLEDVYLEATDHCPIFSQPDQAAVFAELWVLGSQCEQYFCMKPKALGKIIYDRHRAFLKDSPPTLPTNSQGDPLVSGPLMSMYAKPEAIKTVCTDISNDSAKSSPLYRAFNIVSTKILQFGALSIFCLPAVVDLVLLTFLGRGLFMTAYMGDEQLIACCYGLLVSLLLSAGVTGWVGSVGNYYLSNYAYHNMIYFHVQRLSGAFMLSLTVSIVGGVIFGCKVSLSSALTFVAYTMLLSNYLSVLGVMATMHQKGSPLTSGRVVLWRTIPLLLVSPVLSSFVNGHDIAIYLGVGYGFLLLVLYQYRRLCHEWMSWLDKIPQFTEKDIMEWYTARFRRERQSGSTTQVSVISDSTETGNGDSLRLTAIRAFREAVTAYPQGMIHRPEGLSYLNTNNELVQKVARGLPFIEWALKADLGDDTQKNELEVFSVPWFAQVVEALKKRRQMVQGLKEHSIFMLYRYARLDIGQNIGLFLIFLMDRWVSIVMATSSTTISVFSDYTSRYAICFAISYFCFSVVVLDATLQGYWKVSFDLSDEKVSSLEDVAKVTKAWERSRRTKYLSALLILVRRISIIFGCTTILLWFFVKQSEVLEIYYLYSLGYTAVVIFQFNRCFTTNVHHHVVSLLVSAAGGFITGCALHVVYKQDPPVYLDVVALNASSLLAAVLTSMWVLRGPSRQPKHPSPNRDKLVPEVSTNDACEPGRLYSNMNTQIMKQICLGIDVDVEWVGLPSSVREAIVSRVLHQPVRVNRELRDWMETRGSTVKHYDLALRSCLGRSVGPVRTASGWSSTDASTSTSPRLSLARWKHNYIRKACNLVVDIPVSLAKWTAIISAGDANIERELLYSFRHTRSFGGVLTCLVLLIWNLCRYIRDAWIYAFLIFHRRVLVKITRLARHGAVRVLCEDRVVVEQSLRTFTGFLSKTDSDSTRLDIFQGNLQKRPLDQTPQIVALYDSEYRLCASQRGEGRKATRTTYTYAQNNQTRIPNSRTVITGDEAHQTYIYDDKGRAVRGTICFGLSEYTFEFTYARDSQDVIKAVFRSADVESEDALTVYWGTQLSLDTPSGWIPSERKSRVDKRIGDKTFTTRYDYQHLRDPVVTTTVIGYTGEAEAATQAPRLFDHEELLWERPSDVLFENDDLLLHHHVRDIRRAVALSGQKMSLSTVMRPSFWKYRSKRTLYRPVSTGWLRTELWNSWRTSGQLDAITACWVDELILRHERTLRTYWSWRGLGQLAKARQFLDAHMHRIGPATEIAQNISEVCLLPIKPTDLYAMGLGKDANQITTRPQDCFNDTKDRISVIFNDVGCWPDAPGGVSNCRRDLVNGHSTIRNHVLAESGNEYGIPRFQIEKNVQSLKLVPLWGLDCRTPNHGITDNLLESQVDDKIKNTDTKRDIVGQFIPLLTLFVKGARSKHISRRDIITYSNVMLDMFKYFEHKDYNKTWKSKEVAAAWVQAWLIPYEDPDITNPDEYFDIEKPSLSDFRTALAIYTSYFFIFSVQTPEECPQVFQSTHHGISSLFGMLLKYRRGTTFGIWDHAILWRECCLNISPAQSTLSLPVQYMLLAGMGLAMRLAYFHADVVLPCTSVFNPVWEGDLATDSGRLGHVNTFNRKIDPIVNGVSNMDAFKPVDEVRTSTPTVVMLSNVQFIKDIRTAIFAADIIVNRYGFKDYQLHVYGAQDREPEYAIDMAKLIESSGLSNNVILKGFGKPQEVLKDAWLFMNSSLSEGLPLAVAEAALAAVPVVATAVGATSLILTDPDDPSISYGEVVPPNDATALARAQISILAMAGPWAKFAGDNEKRCALPDVLRKEDVVWLSKRMYEKTEARRHLGMLTRQVVIRGFHGERYLREHEQMYWIQWHLAKMRRDPAVMGDKWGVGNGVRWVDDEEETKEKEVKGKVKGNSDEKGDRTTKKLKKRGKEATGVLKSDMV
ncbi:hypothetical protein V8F20_011530 [Naviculisporaceae sp. PSN 640]